MPILVSTGEHRATVLTQRFSRTKRLPGRARPRTVTEAGSKGTSTLLRTIAAVLVALLLSACSHRESPVDRVDREGILHFGNAAEPRDLDPQIITAYTDALICMSLFEGLVLQDPKTLDPVPGVAERWEMSPDGLVYTFHLRDNATWSNGDPITAGDFVYSYHRILSPALGAE